MTLFFFSQVFPFIPFGKFYNLFAEFLQLAGFFGQFIKESKRFFLSVNGVDGLYTLVIVVSNSSELLIESGQLGVILLRFLVNLHNLELSTEDAGKDKFCLVLHARLLEHGDKLLVFPVIETKIIAVRARVGQHLTPCGVTDSCFIFHHMKILKGSTWEDLCPRKTFRARLSAGRNIFNR